MAECLYQSLTYFNYLFHCEAPAPEPEMTPLDAAKKLKEMQLSAWISLSEAFYAQTHDLSNEQQTILSTLQTYFQIPEDVVNKELDRVKSDPLVVQLSKAQQEFNYILLSTFPLF